MGVGVLQHNPLFFCIMVQNCWDVFEAKVLKWSSVHPAGRLYAMQTGMKLDSRSPECRKFLVRLMDQLESVSGSRASGSLEAFRGFTLSLFLWVASLLSLEDGSDPGSGSASASASGPGTSSGSGLPDASLLQI